MASSISCWNKFLVVGVSIKCVINMTLRYLRTAVVKCKQASSNVQKKRSTLTFSISPELVTLPALKKPALLPRKINLPAADAENLFCLSRSVICYQWLLSAMVMTWTSIQKSQLSDDEWSITCSFPFSFSLIVQMCVHRCFHVLAASNLNFRGVDLSMWRFHLNLLS